MHRKIFPHDTFIDASNVECLRGMDFAFLCLDKSRAKQVIVERLEEFGIQFVDVGMGVELVDDSLIGFWCYHQHRGEAGPRPQQEPNRLTGGGREDLYSRNIQIAELNALNAALAVIKSKKHFGFYADLEKEQSQHLHDRRQQADQRRPVMMRTVLAPPELCARIPEKLNAETLYVSIDFATAAHSCCCGCGREVVTPLTPTDWRITYDGVSISLFPSVGNWNFPCRSHYWIDGGRVWADQWSDGMIAARTGA